MRVHHLSILPTNHFRSPRIWLKSPETPSREARESLRANFKLDHRTRAEQLMIDRRSEGWMEVIDGDAKVRLLLFLHSDSKEAVHLCKSRQVILAEGGDVSFMR